MQALCQIHFSPSAVCLFSLLKGSLGKKNFNFNVVQFFIFPFSSRAFGVKPKKFSPSLRSERVSPGPYSTSSVVLSFKFVIHFELFFVEDVKLSPRVLFPVRVMSSCSSSVCRTATCVLWARWCGSQRGSLSYFLGLCACLSPVPPGQRHRRHGGREI